MKILFVAHNWIVKTGYSCAKSLRRLGHETQLVYGKYSGINIFGKVYSRIRDCYFNKKLYDLEQKIYNTLIIRKAKKFNPELVIINCGGEVFPYTVIELKKKARYVVCWAGDNPLTYRNGRSEYINGLKYYDKIILSDKHWYTNDLRENLRSSKVICDLYYGVDLDYFRDLKLKKKIDLSFIGTLDMERKIFLEKISEKYYPEYIIRYWLGKYNLFEFKNFKFDKNLKIGMVRLSKVNKVYNISNIILNFQKSQIISIPNSKFFEIGATNNFQLININEWKNRNDLIIPEDILFKDYQDFSVKFKYFIKRSNERVRIANYLYKQITNKHSWDCRMKYLIDIVNK